METTSTAGATAGVQPQTALYTRTLRDIFEKSLIGSDGKGAWYTALNNPANANIWRSAQAFDTLLDCLSTLKSVIPGYKAPPCGGMSFMDFSLENGLNGKSGDWWDDFGWYGITCIRTAESGEVTPDEQRILLRKAVNAWCYMFGNGWDGANPHKWGDFSVPYGDAWNKEDIQNNIGAPDVFAYATSINMPDPGYYLPFKPFFSPGGVWNSPLTGASPDQYQNDDYAPDATYLNPLQNTVTNAVFTLLSLRVFQVLINPEYTGYFSDKPVDKQVVYDAWSNQISWLHNWLDDPNNELKDADRKLLLVQNSTYSAALVRERVSTYANFKWDSAYRKGLCWTGDQGLMIGVLRESQALIRQLHLPGDYSWMDTYLDLLVGVRTSLYSDQNQPELGVQLRPWVTYNDNSGNAEFDSFPEGDDADYQTGPGVFYRYLLQLQQANAAQAEPFRDLVFQTANTICSGSFPAPRVGQYTDKVPYYYCEGLVELIEAGRPSVELFNNLTPWINRIALLCMAIRFTKS